MKRFFLSFLMMAAAVVGIKAQYDGQCVNIMLESGDSISHDLAINSGLNPQVKDGKIVWNIMFSTLRGDIVHTLDNVTSIEYRSQEQMREQARKALVEFYQATNGDQWNNNTNWCSDKPLEEWFGVTMGYHNAYPYVTNLELSGNNLSGHLPDGDCLLRLGGIKGLYLWDNNIGGNIPQCLEHCYSLSGFFMDRNQLTGEIPASLFDLPYLSYFEVADNKLTGPIPANFSHLMDQGFNKDLS